MNSYQEKYKRLSHYLRLGKLFEDIVEEALVEIMKNLGFSSRFIGRVIHRNNIVGKGSDFRLYLSKRVELECKNWSGDYYLTSKMYDREVRSRFSRDAIKIVIASKLKYSEEVRNRFRRDKIQLLELGYQVVAVLDDEYVVRDKKYKLKKMSVVVEDVKRLLRRCLQLMLLLYQLVQQIIISKFKNQSFSLQLSLPIVFNNYICNDFG